MRMPLLMISRCRHVSIETDMRKYLPIWNEELHSSARCCATLHSKKLIHAGVVVDDGAFHLLNQVGDRDAARAGIRAVKDGAAAPDTVALSQDREPLRCPLITAIKDEAVSIDNRGRTNPVRVAPYGRAGTRTGAAEDTFCALVVALALGGAL